MNSGHQKLQNEQMANESSVRDSPHDAPARIVENVRDEPAVSINYSENSDPKNETPRMLKNYCHDGNPNRRLLEVVLVEEIC